MGTTSYQSFLKQQLDVLEMQKEQVIQAPDTDIPPETRRRLTTNIEEHMKVLEETGKTLNDLDMAGSAPEVQEVDETALQASMDKHEPTDGMTVDAGTGTDRWQLA